MNKLHLSLALAAAILIGFAAGWGLPSGPSHEEHPASASQGDKGEPLYWVAPMDDNYRRDQPGKSPMGMDLVPVYADSEEEAEAGQVRVSPTQAHNLGLTLGQVTRQELSLPVRAFGRVAVNQDLLRHFHVRATGWVSDLSVAAEGDPVQAGQKLFEFYSPEIINLQREYLQGLDSQLPGQAKLSLQKLRVRGVSEREIERLQKTREIREKIHYYAEKGGYVSQLGIREGKFVDLPQNLMSLGSLENIWVLVDVFERQAGLLGEGQEVELSSDTYPGETWRGRIDYLYPTLNPGNRSQTARLVFPNQDGRLKPGMYIQAQIDTGTRQALLTMPRSALIETGQGQRVVLETGPGEYRSVPVKAGIGNRERVQVLAGLNEGDRVVTSAQFLIDSESSREADLSRLDSGASDGDAMDGGTGSTQDQKMGDGN